MEVGIGNFVVQLRDGFYCTLFCLQGVTVLDPYITLRRIKITKDDIITILGQENPFLTKCTEKTQEQLKQWGMCQSLLEFVKQN